MKQPPVGLIAKAIDFLRVYASLYTDLVWEGILHNKLFILEEGVLHGEITPLLSRGRLP